MLCTELTLAKLAVLREIPSCLKNRLNLSFFNMVILHTKLLTMFVPSLYSCNRRKRKGITCRG